ncbi:hypothetical protein V3C99_002672 [Haemonchus contortus]
MVLKKTPKHLISYSVLFFDTAFCDLVACTGAIFMLLRVVSFGPNSYNFYYGPCRLFGPGICMIAQGLILSCHHHGIHSLLVSFAYRYYVLVRNPPRVYKVAATVILVYLPTFFVFALAIQACLPLLYLGGIAVNMVGLLNIYNHPIMEYAFVYLFVPIPAINPLVSLYFVGPYRIWIHDKFFKSKQSTAKETAVTTVTALQQNGMVAPMQPQLLHS